MIVAVLSDIGQDWAGHFRDAVGERTTILQTRSPEATIELLQSVAADLIVVELPQITQQRLDALAAIQTQAPDAVHVCIAPDDVIEYSRAEGLAEPTMWVRAEIEVDDRKALFEQALELARLRTERDAMLAGTKNGAPVIHDRDGHRSPELETFHRLMVGLAGGFDLDRLLEAYVDAVTRFSQCASYCLLWETPSAALSVRSHRGIPAEVVEGARLLSCDALPSWYRRNRRVLTRAELASWPDRQMAVQVDREMGLFGGQIALPLMVRGRLSGILMLGERVLGEGYSESQVEMLFAVTNYVAMAAEGIELHEELGRAKSYTDRIVENMSAGMITLGSDERIAVCNPYAAEVLGLSRAEVEGADLRVLPSPLGDMLYAALRSPHHATSGEEVTIKGGTITLRVTTSTLLDDRGTPLGSILILADITAEKELARERSRLEQLNVLNRIIGRIAHEVKNPLTAVKTYAELMSGGRADEQLAQFWSQTVLPEIDHLDELLKNLLRMVEQPEPHIEIARPEDLIGSALDVLPMPEEIKRQAFDLQVKDGVPAVMVDPTPTRDALSYLLRYLAGSRPHPVEINVDWRPEEPSQVIVTMKSRARVNGEFDPTTIFDPLHAMQDPDIDLGPVISQKIITNQHGEVEAFNEEGRITMRVVLPRSDTLTQIGPEVAKGGS